MATEPQPSVRLAGEDDDGSIERFEVVAARRALALLKTRLGRERLLELLADEIAAGSAYLREQVAASAGQETTGMTTLRAHGITAAEFTGWLAQAFGRGDVMRAGHPEHYSIHAHRRPGEHRRDPRRARLLALPLDVTDGAQVDAAVTAAVERFGRIDVLVNNAGRDLLGAVEAATDAEVRAVFETDVFGLLAVTPELEASRPAAEATAFDVAAAG